MMAREATNRTNVSTASDARGLSQVIFVAVGLTIIVGGLWMLYMGDAPYHPEVTQAEGIELIRGKWAQD